MTERKNYEISEADYAALVEASRPDVTMDINLETGITIYTHKNTAAAANAVRTRMAAEMGYDPATVEMDPARGKLAFTAVPV